MVMARAFARAWSGTGTQRARSFYLVFGRLFFVLAIGIRREGSLLNKDTDDGR